ncbi:hypothetical protein ASG11_05985 [Sphingomonas sp. Leaf357]|uniref:ATP-binding protein n=1 Tax=Sphingomonas sp. Leaf357 TaxID=1736350 RepID=UPI0006F64A4F|nr:ATP-binding protein [Sphingomonas sp. Leaf357]KQS05204.1 hypothetical protein ASG11_05985 [Sphingomonas sp. Leaf357]
MIAGAWGFAGSLAGRLALLLTIGMSISAITALFVAEEARRHDFAQFLDERLVVSAVDIVGRMTRAPDETAALLDHNQIIGAHRANPRLAVPTGSDSSLDAALRDRLGVRARARGLQVPWQYCFARIPYEWTHRAAGFFVPQLPGCWVVSYNDAKGQRISLAFDLPTLSLPPSAMLNPLFLLLIVAASGALSVVVSRLATAPLRRLTSASRAFARTIDAEPVAERGPSDVRETMVAFNTMQSRVREGVRERTRILASISHDLQTPLTRLRLRLEQVQDATLRDRLIADLGATLALVRDGLDLARSSESREEWSVIDLDSLLSALAEDAAEFGAKVHFVGGCGAQARVKPDALSRCVTNLIDNAVRYGGGADVSCTRRADAIEIAIRDYGPGIAEDLLPKIFEPFVRGSGDSMDNGTGIGLTIARAQAETFGAQVNLSNHPGGGMVAVVRIVG